MPMVTMAPSRATSSAWVTQARKPYVADPLVRRQHRHHPRRIAPRHLERAEADAGRRVARFGLDDDVVARDRRRRAEHLVDLIGGGDDEDALRRHHPRDARDGGAEQRFAVGEHREELLGPLLAGRRP
jgi:hypothetical protein